MEKIWDCVVVGAGVSGMTAAMYLKRANINVLIIEKASPGGLIAKSSIVENYPGQEAISGPDLALNFFNQIKKLEIPMEYGEVKEIKNAKEDIKTVVLENKEIKTKKIILAIGREPRKLEDTNQERAEGKGVSYCSLCDGPLYKNEDVAIVGAGVSAIEEALYLSDICKKVYILYRGAKINLVTEQVLKERILEKENVEILLNTQVKDFILKDDKLEELIITQNNEEKSLKVKACFIFIGYTPATNFLKTLDILNEKGYINVDENKETEIKGIFASGDVVEKSAYQVATATGDAVLAAYKCIKELKE